jgi:hypothetical protein
VKQNSRRNLQKRKLRRQRLEWVKVIESQTKAAARIMGFCQACGADIPPRLGEGTCAVCDPRGVELNQQQHAKGSKYQDSDGPKGA